MARPEFYPEWALVEQMLPVAETINRTRPKESLRDVGYDKDQVPTAQEFNWQLNNIYEWIKDLDERLLSGTLNLEDVYPIGSIYINKTDSRNPSEILGVGTWVSLEGRVLVGIGTAQDTRGETKVFAEAETGGEFSHVQTVEELAVHRHTLRSDNGSGTPFEVRGLGNSSVLIGNDDLRGSLGYFDKSLTLDPWVGDSGASQPMNVVQPYTTAYMWERIS